MNRNSRMKQDERKAWIRNARKCAKEALQHYMKCERCGQELRPAPAWFDGIETTVGYMPCNCDRKEID